MMGLKILSPKIDTNFFFSRSAPRLRPKTSTTSSVQRLPFQSTKQTKKVVLSRASHLCMRKAISSRPKIIMRALVLAALFLAATVFFSGALAGGSGCREKGFGDLVLCSKCEKLKDLAGDSSKGSGFF
jgi:hypothetical protein